MNNITLEMIATVTLPFTKKVTLLIASGEIEIATISIEYSQADKVMGITIDDICDSQAGSFDMLRVVADVMNTITHSRSNNATIEGIFGSDGCKVLLVTNPMLYTVNESCNDSDTKQVECESCGITYDGELAHWVEGEEECPHCDHVQLEAARVSPAL